MYAIVEIQGQQFKAEAGKKLFVNRLDAERGSEVSFEKVMLVEKNGEVKIGAPYVEGAKVVCEVLSHLKGDKVIVFKKKRRKGYRKLNGYRPYLSELKIKELVGA